MIDRARNRVRGRRLQILALRVFGPEIARRYLFPAIADLQYEQGTAAPLILRWRRTLAAYAAFWTTMVACFVMPRVDTGDSRGSFAPSFVKALLAALVLLLLPPLSRGTWSFATAAMIRARVPQALAIALPMALLFAVLSARFEGADNSDGPRLPFLREVTLTAVVVATLAFVVLAWLVPLGNQLSREQEYRQWVGQRGVSSALVALPPKGPNEMTLSELGDALRRTTNDRWRAKLAFSRQQRFAIPAAGIAFALLAVALPRPRATRWPKAHAVVAAFLVVCGWYLLHVVAQNQAVAGRISPVFAAWAANLMCVAVAVSSVSVRLLRLETSR